MKTLAKLLFLTSVFLFISQVSFSQSFLDRVKQKTKEKIEQRIDEKVDKEIDKGLDKVENSIDSIAGTGESSDDASTSAKQNRMSKMLQGMGMSGDPVPVEDSYKFTQLVQMQIEMYDNEEKKSNNGEFITHLNPNSNSLAYEVVSNDIGDNEQGIFIIDTKNKAIILLNDKDGEKTGMVYGMGSFMESIPSYEDAKDVDPDLDDDAQLLNANVTKTGKTKNIAGYKCQQYVYNTDETESEFWITDELKTSSNDFFSTLFKTSAFTNGMGYGYVMESVNKDITTGNKSSMKVTKVDNHSNKNFNLSSFQITNLGSFQMPSDKED